MKKHFGVNRILLLTILCATTALPQSLFATDASTTAVLLPEDSTITSQALSTSKQTSEPPAITQQKQPTTWEQIAKLYLPSITIEQKDNFKLGLAQNTTGQSPETGKDEEFHIVRESEQLQKIVATTPTTNHMAQLLFYLDNKEQCLIDASASIIDDTTYRDLNIFCGQQESSTTNLITKTDHTITLAGRAAYLNLLYTPTTDTNALMDRQAAIKELLNNAELYTKLVENFNRIKDGESAFFLFLNALSLNALKKLTERFYFKGIEDIPPISLIPLLPQLVQLTKKIPAVARVDKRMCETLNHMPTLLQWTNLLDHTVGTIVPPVIVLAFATYFGYGAYKNYTNDGLNGEFAQNTLYSGVFTAIGTLSIKELIKALYDQLATEEKMCEFVTHIASMVSAIQETQQLMEQHSIITHVAPCSTMSNSTNADFKKLLFLLNQDSFKKEHKPSKGTMMAALNLLYTHINEIIPFYIEMGKLDALLSVATLYKTYESHPTAKYYFATYEHQTTPHLKLDNFWNPFINPDIVVTNSLELGNLATYRDLLLTGPNAGGKSTALKAIAYAVLLAQTLTITNGRMTLTPFSKVYTTLNITDTVGKESLFQADKNRIKTVLTNLEALKPEQFALLISDEMFNSTGAAYGSALFYGTLKYVNDALHNALFAAATHFEQLTELEQDTQGSIANFRVEEAAVGLNDKLAWSYKIKPGINKQNISFELAKEDGFNDNILAAGEKLLRRHAY